MDSFDSFSFILVHFINFDSICVTGLISILDILEFYVNEEGEKKPGKNGIVLDLEEFEALVKVVPKVQDSIARYELKDTGIPSSPFELDLPVLDLDTVFLPSPSSQEPIPIIRNEELLNSQPKVPASPPLFIEPSLETELNDLDLYFYMPGERRKRTNEASIDLVLLHETSYLR